MLIGAKDRTYYRVQSNAELVDEAKYNPNVELCIVLAERLKQAEWDVKEAQYNCDYTYD